MRNDQYLTLRCSQEDLDALEKLRLRLRDAMQMDYKRHRLMKLAMRNGIKTLTRTADLAELRGG